MTAHADRLVREFAEANNTLVDCWNWWTAGTRHARAVAVRMSRITSRLPTWYASPTVVKLG
jgi:hypothetical protein